MGGVMAKGLCANDEIPLLDQETEPAEFALETSITNHVCPLFVLKYYI